MEDLIAQIEDKIIESENCEDVDISQDYLNGYINGLKMAITLIKERGN